MAEQDHADKGEGGERAPSTPGDRHQATCAPKPMVEQLARAVAEARGPSGGRALEPPMTLPMSPARNGNQANMPMVSEIEPVLAVEVLGQRKELHDRADAADGMP